MPLGSYSGDFPSLHSKNERNCIISSIIRVPCSKGHLDRLLGRFYYFLTEEGAVSSALSFSAGRGAHLGAG